MAYEKVYNEYTTNILFETIHWLNYNNTKVRFPQIQWLVIPQSVRKGLAKMGKVPLS